jgi:L-alanine-DL-glutamate epimerase-like enolase superfamily enzyme
LKILSLTAEHVQLELHNPFVLSIRTATHANIIRWKLLCDAGSEQRIVLGECVPVQYVTGETIESTLATAPQLSQIMSGCDVSDMHKIVAEVRKQLPLAKAAIAGVEIALYNAFAAETGVTMHQHLGGKGVEVMTDLTIAKIPNAIDVAEKAWAQGFRSFKLKVGGQGYNEDLDRIRQMYERLPEMLLRLDPNQGFDAPTALRFIDDVLKLGVTIEFVEQPTPKHDRLDLDEVSANSPVPVIADEGCTSAKDAYELFADTSVHGVNVKLMKSGIAESLEIISIAKAAGKKLMIGCMLESEIGMAASVALASGTGAFDYVDLDGHLLVKYDAPFTSFVADGPLLKAL